MIRKAYFDSGEGQIHYRYRAGEGTPWVLLHQTASSSAMFEAVMRELPATGAVYALDTPGFGGSTRPVCKPTVATYVSALLQAIDALGLKQFNLFGHHTGAAIACQLAAEHPERVLRLGMIGPVQLSEEERTAWRGSAIKPLTIELQGTHLYEVWQRVTHLDTQPIAYPATAELATREAIDTLIAGDRWHEAYEAVFNQDFPALLAQVRCPLWFACGEADVLYPYFQRACLARPDAWRTELKGGAYLLDQQPARMAELMVDFFTRNA